MIWLSLIVLISSVVAQGTYETIKEANNLFAVDIYPQIIQPDTGNVIVSPLSAETVLTLLHCGTKGESSQQLGTALHLPDDHDLIKDETKNLLTDLQESTGGTIIEIANGVFVQEDFDLNEEFSTIATEDFFATFQALDFAENVEAASVINDYVEEHTNHLIKDLLSPDALNGDTRVVLVNALRFQGNWSYPFSVDLTEKKDFFSPNGVIQVDTLYRSELTLNYFRSESLNAEFLELPFVHPECSFVIALPQEQDGLANLEAQISQVFVSSIAFENRFVNVALPKFKIDFTVDFTEVLHGLGVHQIFDASTADLSGIAGNKGDLYVSDVVQKAYIDLNEGGVEAAAATVAVVSTTSVGINQIDFIADRPFVFFIKHSGTILFIGRITEPKYD